MKGVNGNFLEFEYFFDCEHTEHGRAQAGNLGQHLADGASDRAGEMHSKLFRKQADGFAGANQRALHVTRVSGDAVRPGLTGSTQPI
jgi:hypothetical protein